MKPLTTLHLLAITPILVVAAITFNGPVSLFFWTLCATMPLIFLARWLEVARNTAIKRALPALDYFHDGRRFVGSGATVVDTTRMHSSYRQLCLSSKGSWFVIEFGVTLNVPRDIVVVEVLNKTDAARWLLRNNKAAYEKHFGNLSDLELA